MRSLFLAAFALALFASSGRASQIKRISLSELEAKATYVVMATVTKVDAMGDSDTVSIRVSAFLKGKSADDEFTFTLITRGGLKDFDPMVKVGDTGVFFLRSLDEKRNVEKAYWGSIAIFPKNHFDVPGTKREAKPIEPTPEAAKP